MPCSRPDTIRRSMRTRGAMRPGHATPTGRTVPSMRVALVHDWLTGRRGGEQVLAGSSSGCFRSRRSSPSSRSRGAWAQTSSRGRSTPRPCSTCPASSGATARRCRLMPAALRSFDLRGFDLVISSSHCVAKGVRVPRGTPHLAYVHAPMRYMWDQFDDYFGPGRASLAVRLAAAAARPALQAWDRRTAADRRLLRRQQRPRGAAHRPVLGPPGGGRPPAGRARSGSRCRPPGHG